MSKKKCPPAGAPDWMVSYGDMMSLLLTFFIMLFAISSLDAKKAEAIAYVMQDTFGTQRNMVIPMPGNHSTTMSSVSRDNNRSMTVNTIQHGNPTRSPVQVRLPKEKIRTGIVTFENDSDTLTQESIQTLAEIYGSVKGSSLMIELRGHTGLSERGPNRNSMDLGYARAHKVWEYLIGKGVNPSRIIITSMGPVKTAGSVPPGVVGGSNSYVDVLLISEAPSGNPEP